MATVPKFRIDVNVHSLLMSSVHGPELPVNHGLTRPEPIYLRFAEKLPDPAICRDMPCGPMSCSSSTIIARLLADPSGLAWRGQRLSLGFYFVHSRHE